MKGHCHVAEGGCTAPAGIGVRGLGYASMPQANVVECVECHQHVCNACSTKRGRRRICNYCEDEENEG